MTVQHQLSSPSSAPQAAIKASRKGLGCGQACLILIVLFGAFVGFVIMMSPCEKDTNQLTGAVPISTSLNAAQLSKAQWKAAVPQNGMLVGFGQIACNKDALFQAVGQPSREEAIGDDQDLYWDCSDGQVEIVAVRGQYEVGLVAGRLNEF